MERSSFSSKMNFLALANYLFIIIFVFTTNVVFANDIQIMHIYKLPKLNEDYASYKNSVVRSNERINYEYQNILDKETFFNMTHNLQNRRIPKRKSDTYDYRVYCEEFEKYCTEEHNSYKLSKTFNRIGLTFCGAKPAIKEIQTDCLKEKMNEDMYNLSQMQYHFIPLPDDKDVNVYLERLNHLYLSIGEPESKKIYNSFYQTYINEPMAAVCENDKNNYFIKLSGRRAIENEKNYNDYALRVLAKDYHPLPYDLWIEEFHNLNNWKRYIDMEDMFFK